MTIHKVKAPAPMMVSSVALGFIVLSLVIYIFHVARAILIPFIIALFVWYLINALARGLHKQTLFKKRIPRFLCFSLAVFAILCGVSIVFELVLRNISHVIEAAPIYQQNFQKIIPKLVSLFHLEYAPTIRDLLTYVDLGKVMTVFAKMFTGFAYKTLIVIFYVGFLLYEQRFFDKKIIGMIEDKRTENLVRQSLANIDAKMQRYIGVKSFVSLIDSILTFGILSYFGIDFAAFWALMAFFLHFIPYAGSFIALSLPSTIALIQYGDMNHGLMVLGSLSLSHIFLGHFLDPMLMGKNLNLSPIFIISSLAIWGMIWGIPGMFLAIPILMMILITLSQFPYTKPLAILISKTGEIDKDDIEENVNHDIN